jgi:hypothetical protein
MSLETTCRMPRKELLGLLNTMTPVEHQRITAKIAAVEPPVVVVEEKPVTAVTNYLTDTRLIVIATSFVVAFCIGALIAVL